MLATATSKPLPIPIPSHPAKIMTPREILIHAREEMNKSLVERTGEIDLALTGLVAGENLLLIGPPGTAKSLLLASLSQLLGGEFFSILLTKFTTPEEVWGPLDLPALKERRYERVLDGYLGTADVAFLDEIFKSSSAILNTLLTALNEGIYKQGSAVIRIPLRFTVAASNEWPSAENGQQELGALFDRFTLRKSVQPVRHPDSRRRLLFDPDESLIPRFKEKLEIRTLDQIRQDVRRIKPSTEFMDAMETCLTDLRDKGISPGDRRIRKAFKICQASAYLNASDTVQPEHGVILEHVLWDDPVSHPKITSEVVNKSFDPLGSSLASLLAEADEVLSKLKPTDLTSLKSSSKKLTEIGTSLKKLGTTSRIKTAIEWVNSKNKEIIAKAFDI